MEFAFITMIVDDRGKETHRTEKILKLFRISINFSFHGSIWIVEMQRNIVYQVLIKLPKILNLFFIAPRLINLWFWQFFNNFESILNISNPIEFENLSMIKILNSILRM